MKYFTHHLFSHEFPKLFQIGHFQLMQTSGSQYFRAVEIEIERGTEVHHERAGALDG